MLLLLILPALLCPFGLSQTIENESPIPPSEVETTTHFHDELRGKRGASVIGLEPAKFVSFPELNREKRAVDKLSDKDKSLTLEYGRETRSIIDVVWPFAEGSGEDKTTMVPIEDEREKREIVYQVELGGPELNNNLKKKRCADQEKGVAVDDEISSSDTDSTSVDSVDDELTKMLKAPSIEDVAVKGSGESIVETTTVKEGTKSWSFRRFAKTAPSTPPAESDNVAGGGDAFTDDTQFEGSGIEYPRTKRDSPPVETEATLGDETPVTETDISEQKRPDFRPRPSPLRPDLTCAAVECIRGTQCIIENGRPACKPFTREPERSCRDVNCPRDARCRMERDPRCRGRDCSEQPICVREERGATCRNVQCPRGTRCNIVEDPNCRGFRCREVATCTNPCDGVRCPFGTSCRFDGFDALCAPIAINPCLNTRCPSGFECRSVQNQAQCFAISTPAPTTSSPSNCPGMNEEFVSCATFCEPNCALKNPSCVSACSTPRCQCSSGFFRNQQGVCVLEEQCDFVPSCGLNESFNECSTVCEPKCGQPVQIACPAICGPAKCQCKQGFWRHPSGSCVQQNQCFFG